MKQTQHISIYILSFLIMYAGAGVSIFHHCCVGCEVEGTCCAVYEKNVACCEKNEEEQADFDCNICEDGCSVTTYSIDLIAKTVEDNHINCPAFDMMNHHREVPGIFCASCNPKLLGSFHNLPPPLAFNSRLYLALYSVLII